MFKGVLELFKMNESIYKKCPYCTESMSLYLLLHKIIYINVCFKCQAVFDIQEYVKQNED